MSAAIARPIVALTEFTRRYRRDGKLTAARSGGSGEVEELATAFVDMVAHIDMWVAMNTQKGRSRCRVASRVRFAGRSRDKVQTETYVDYFKHR